MMPPQDFESLPTKLEISLAELIFNKKVDVMKTRIELLELIAKEHAEAKQLLQDAGYGVTGTPLIDRVKEVLKDLELFRDSYS